jgi:hypothetical protein
MILLQVQARHVDTLMNIVYDSCDHCQFLSRAITVPVAHHPTPSAYYLSQTPLQSSDAIPKTPTLIPRPTNSFLNAVKTHSVPPQDLPLATAPCPYPQTRRVSFGFGFGGGSGSNTGVTDPNVKLNELNLPISVPTSNIRKSRKNRPKDLTTTMALPPLYDSGTFCPDDGSGCRLVQSIVDGPCELGRDEQCAQPGNLSTTSSIGSTLPTTTTDVAGVPICLHLT